MWNSRLKNCYQNQNWDKNWDNESNKKFQMKATTENNDDVKNEDQPRQTICDQFKLDQGDRVVDKNDCEKYPVPDCQSRFLFAARCGGRCVEVQADSGEFTRCDENGFAFRGLITEDGAIVRPVSIECDNDPNDPKGTPLCK